MIKEYMKGMSGKQQIKLGIFCVKQVLKCPTFNSWANDWLRDRTQSESFNLKAELSEKIGDFAADAAYHVVRSVDIHNENPDDSEISIYVEGAIKLAQMAALRSLAEKAREQ